MYRDSSHSKSSSVTTRRQQSQQHVNNQSSVATPLLGAVCATVVLLAALFHRCARTQYGPCTVDIARRTVLCIRSRSLTALPNDIPDITLVLAFTNDSYPDGRLIENDFTTLQRSNFTRLRRLRDLSLISCGIERLERLTFIDLSDLRRLDLRYNRLHHLANGPFGGITKLDILLLSGNPLMELGANAMSGLTASRLEFVSNSNLSRINESAFEQSRISMMTFDRCNLEIIDESTWKHLASSLRELSVVNNLTPLKVEQNALNGFRLRRLTLINDSLTDARFLLAGDHDVISLDNNIHLWNTTSLNSTSGARKKTKRLSLSVTGMVELSDALNMSMFDALEELDISDNNISVFDASEFSALDRLRVLDLSDNQVDQFAGDFENELTFLEVLRLERNHLQTVPESLAKPLFVRLKSGVTLSDNPLHYNCELQWLSTTSVQLDDLTDNDVASDVSDDLFQCHQPVIVNTTVDESTLVCIATGDPAPRVSWSAAGVELLNVEQSRTIRNQLSTRADLTISRPGNYTCTAANVAGHVNVTIFVDEVIAQATEQKLITKYETISILMTPSGFTLTAILLVLLGYLFKNQ
jgi:Leucine-rich repeat (LRR) protein